MYKMLQAIQIGASRLWVQEMVFNLFNHPLQTLSRAHPHSFSCGLEVLKVDPEAIAFEMADIEIGLGADQYRDYQLAKRRKKPVMNTHRQNSQTSITPATAKQKSNRGYDDPQIDLVCKRLIVKWQPMFNVVHRYVHCRCVLRRTTPSRVEKEQTLLVVATCPRHNRNNSSRRDYGDLDYNKDPYFDQFGGYRAFQGFVYMFAGNIYDILGGEKFIPAEHIDEAKSLIDERIEADLDGLKEVFFEYYFEVNDAVEKAGIELPESEARFVEVERQRRKEKVNKDLGIEPDDGEWGFSEEQRQHIYESPMMREVREILDGKWHGKNHWEVED